MSIALPSFTIHDIISNSSYLIFLLPVAALLGGLGRRAVGGVIEDWTGYRAPGLPAKIFFAVCVGVAVFLGGAQWWGAIVIGIGAWIGHVIRGLWNSAAMGHYGDQNELWTFWGHGRWTSKVDGAVHSKPGFVLSCLGMSAYGLSVVAAAIAVSLCPLDRGIWALEVAAGLSTAPVYALSWVIWPKETVRVKGIDDNPLPEAEWLWGFALGAFVFLGFVLS